MHTSVYEWVDKQVDQYDLADQSVAEIGSYNVNGSVRSLFKSTYVGFDIIPGPDVDVVYDGLHLPVKDKTFDIVISVECFEHAARPWRVAAEMYRVAKPGAMVLVTARGFDESNQCFPHHCPPDLWRYGKGALSEVFLDAGFSVISEERDHDLAAAGYFLIGRK